MLLLRNKDR